MKSKRRFGLIIILLSAFLLSSCGGHDGTPNGSNGKSEGLLFIDGSRKNSATPTAKQEYPSPDEIDGAYFFVDDVVQRQDELSNDRFVFVDSDSEYVKEYLAKKTTPAPNANIVYDASYLFVKVPKRGGDSIAKATSAPPSKEITGATVTPLDPTKRPSADIASLEPRSPLFQQTGGSRCRYAYLMLTNAQKQLYSEMYDAVLRFEETIVLKGDYCEDDYLRVFYVFNNECPELFQLTSSGSYGCDSTRLTWIQPEYRLTRLEYESAWKRIEKIVADIRNDADFGQSDYEHAIAVERYLVARVTYHLGEQNSYVDTVLLKGDGKCDGYSNAAMLLMRCYGIPTAGVTGWTYDKNGVRSESPHRWNMILLDGAWYHSDTTWNDDDGDFEKYFGANGIEGLFYLPYTNISDRKMLFRRDVDMFNCDWSVPTAIDSAQEYYRHTGYIATSGADFVSSVHSAISMAYINGKDAVAISFADPQTLANHMNDIRTTLVSWSYDDCEIGRYAYIFLVDIGTLILTDIQIREA